jgi:hypothetical protein
MTLTSLLPSSSSSSSSPSPITFLSSLFLLHLPLSTSRLPSPVRHLRVTSNGSSVIAASLVLDPACRRRPLLLLDRLRVKIGFAGLASAQEYISSPRPRPDPPLSWIFRVDPKLW